MMNDSIAGLPLAVDTSSASLTRQTLDPAWATA